MWETAKLIATSQCFIGVNSSMMNIAQAYPRIHRKVFANRKDLDVYRPMGPLGCWLDHGFTLITDSENDEGVAFSYKKI